MLETLPAADRQRLLSRIRTVEDAEEWLDHIANAQTFVMGSPL